MKIKNVFYSLYARYSIWKAAFKKGYYTYRYTTNASIAPSVFFGKYSEIEINSSKAHLLINEGVYFRKHCHLFLDKNGRLEIGKDVFFNNYCSISCLGNIEIGENTLFGEGVKMYDHNHKYGVVNSDLVVKKNEFKIGSIIIGKKCWIGSNVTILNNVEIGDNVIIGAGCLIYKSIPANSIVKASLTYDIQPLI